MSEKTCENCRHYDFYKCLIDGEYTSNEWYCELWEKGIEYE